jgi:hypothetical protein
MSAVPAAQAPLESSYVLDGREITTPVKVGRAVSASAIFLVSAKKARRFVPQHDLFPAEILPGRAALCLKFTNYIDSDFGPYNELSMEFLVRPAGRSAKSSRFTDTLSFIRSALPSYVYRRFTNSPFAARATNEIWGFNQTVGQVSVEAVGTRYQGKLVLDGQHVMSFSVPLGGRRVIPENDQCIYSHVDGELCEIATASASEKVGVHLGGARVTLGTHAYAGELGNLGLPKHALATVWRGKVSRRLDAPFPV